MKCKHLFALTLVLFVMGFSATILRAQDRNGRERSNDGSTTVETNEEGTRPRLVNKTAIVSEVAPPRARPAAAKATPVPATRLLGNRAMAFNQMLQSAIDKRLGSPYLYGSVGPNNFDCSGFVWSVYQELGVNFTRGSARSLYSMMEPVPEEQRFVKGNLVFFSGLSHVGIVADENGFYHASHSHGITYSPFNNYWLERIDGFRRVIGTAKVNVDPAKQDRPSTDRRKQNQKDEDQEDEDQQ